VEIVADVIDEMRRERKITMAIKDATHVKEYLKIDLADAETMDFNELSPA
jgi:uncharacterized protein YwlG (UPF0340 family)